MKRSMISPDDALRRTLELARRGDPEEIELDEALGRVLSEELLALWDLPAYDNSAMDGYAIRAADTEGASGAEPVRLELVGAVFAGEPASTGVGPGQAVRIMTGAALPPGADTVVRQEATNAADGAVDVRVASVRGNNVRLRGEAIRQGARVIAAGTRIRSEEVSLLAAFGRSKIRVGARPTLHVLTCGDELHPVDRAGEGRTVDSNGPMLACMARESGASASRSGPVRDDPELLRGQILRALVDAEVLVTVGGASVGERDLVVRALLDLGAELVFQRVALKPGKPVALLLLRGKVVFVLPGNPAACAMTFDRFVRPFLLVCQGMAREAVVRPRLPALLKGAVHKQPALTYYLRGQAELGPRGLEITLPERQSSGQLNPGHLGNAIATIPAGPGEYGAGAEVEVELLGPPLLAPRPPVLAFAGYSGSGKTTAMVALIARLRARGLRIAALKHDAHGFQLDREGKDTARFTAAGATAIAIASRDQRAVIATTQRPSTLAELISTLSVGVDMILVEGYKHDDIAKIVVHRAGVREAPTTGAGVLAVLRDTPLPQGGLPVIPHDAPEQLEAFVLGWYRGQPGTAREGAPRR